MKIISIIELLNVLGSVKLEKVENLDAKIGIVNLCVELKQHYQKWEEFRQQTKDMDPANADTILNKEAKKDIVVNNITALTPTTVKQIIASNPNMLVVHMAILSEQAQP